MPFEPRGSFKAPTDPDQKIWRYLTLSKFMYVLHYRALPFVRLDLMPDPFEGSPSEAAIDRLAGMVGDSKFPAQQFIDLAGDHYAHNRANVYINCWHQAAHESGAMWAIYSNEGVAIESTYTSLVEAISEDPRPVHIGRVKYENNDVRLDMGLPIIHAVRKRRYYEYEKELRAAVTRTDDDVVFDEQAGKLVPKKSIDVGVDLPTLIQRLWISPNDKRLLPLMRDILRFYGLDIELSASWLGKTPPFGRR